MSHRHYVVDMGRCMGCKACSVACKDRAGLPDELDLLRVERNESGAYPDVDMYYRVMHCFHCENPSCQDSCPADAISKNEDGFVLLDLDSCTGCGNCREACPFESIVKLPNGLYTKCDGCYDEVSGGLDPTCVRACLTRALSYETVDVPLDRLDEAFNTYGIGPSVIFRLKRKN